MPKRYEKAGALLGVAEILMEGAFVLSSNVYEKFRMTAAVGIQVS